jgi:hypothetical protein
MTTIYNIYLYFNAVNKTCGFFYTQHYLFLELSFNEMCQFQTINLEVARELPLLPFCSPPEGNVRTSKHRTLPMRQPKRFSSQRRYTVKE